MNWIWVLVVVWLGLLFLAFTKYRQQVAAVLGNQEVVKQISRQILDGRADQEVISYIKTTYKVNGMAAASSHAQIKKVLAQRQIQKKVEK